MEQNLPEKSLFFVKKDSQLINGGNSSTLSQNSVSNDFSPNLQVEKERDNIQRKNKILGFSIKFIISLIVIILSVMIIDIIINYLEIESDLVLEAFNLLKYCVSTTLGYIFGRETG